MRSFWQRRRRVHCLTTCLLATGIALTLAGPGSVLAQNKPATIRGGRKSPRPSASSRACRRIRSRWRRNPVATSPRNLLASTKILRVPPGEKDLKNATVSAGAGSAARRSRAGSRAGSGGRAHHRRARRHRDEAGRRFAPSSSATARTGRSGASAAWSAKWMRREHRSRSHPADWARSNSVAVHVGKEHDPAPLRP